MAETKVYNVIDLMKKENEKLIKEMWMDDDCKGETYKTFKSDNEINPLKANKVLYFLYGYFYKKYKRVLFRADFQAWNIGPVEMNYFVNKKEHFDVELNKDELEYVKVFIHNLLKYSTFVLVQQSHLSTPWIDHYDKNNLEANKKIPSKEIQDYFKKLKFESVIDDTKAN